MSLNPGYGYKQHSPTNPGGTVGTNVMTGQQAAGSLIGPEQQHLKSQYDFYNGLQPLQQQMMGHYLSLMANPYLMSQQARGLFDAQGNANLQGLNTQLAGMNTGVGEANGALLANRNQANEAGNAYDANLFSPQGQGALGAGVSQIYNSMAPNAQNLNTLAQTQWGPSRAPDNTMAGIGSLLGGVAGIAGLF